MSDTNTLRRILIDNRTLAVVGLSGNWYRPSFFASKYMQEHGYRVIPVNPNYEEILGEKCYPDLASIPGKVDLVDLFQRAELIPEYTRQAHEIGANTVWCQLGIESEEAREIAEANNMDFVQNHCVKIEHARIFGGLNFVGVNTNVISSRRNKHIAN